MWELKRRIHQSQQWKPSSVLHTRQGKHLKKGVLSPRNKKCVWFDFFFGEKLLKSQMRLNPSQSKTSSQTKPKHSRVSSKKKKSTRLSNTQSQSHATQEVLLFCFVKKYG